MTDKETIQIQQKAHCRTEKALNEARALILESLNDLNGDRTIAAKVKLQNYVRGVMAGG